MSDSRQLDHQMRIDRVQAKITKDLSTTLDLEELARLAGLSPFHFHRVFRAFCGETLGQHVRRLRLERAALLLRHSDRGVTDVALAVGYESPAAFSRAFERHFSASPSQWRVLAETGLTADGKSPVGTLAPITPEAIKQRLPTRVVFVRRHGPYTESAPAAWAALMGTMSWRLWLHFPSEMIGLCHDDPDITAPEHVRYDACLHLRRRLLAHGELAEQVIPGGRHAVFLHVGPHDRLVETYDRIYGAWLPSAREEPAEAPAFEVYLDHPDRIAPEKLRTLIHLPLRDRQ